MPYAYNTDVNEASETGSSGAAEDQVAQLALTSTVTEFANQARSALGADPNSVARTDDPIVEGLEAISDSAPWDEAVIGRISKEKRFGRVMKRADQQFQARASEKRNATQVGHVVSTTPTAPRGQTALAEGKYVLEAQDEKHRMGDVLFEAYRIYERDTIAKPFFDWLNALSYFEMVKLLKEIGKSDAWIRQFAPAFTTGVAYMDAAARRRCQVQVRRNKLMLGDVVLDTERMKLQTVFSGIGWGIWVMSPRQNLYTASHVKGALQHSSFLSGGNVLGAGEWKVEDGYITHITGKSGHYRCDLEALARVLGHLQARGVPLGQAKVVVWKFGETKGSTVPAPDFLADPSLRQNASAIGRTAPYTAVRSRQNLIGAHRPVQ